MNRLGFLFCFVCLPWFCFSQKTTSNSAPKQIPGTEGQKMHDEAKVNSLLPSFYFATDTEKFLTEKDLAKNKSIVLALFNPTCDHCLQVAYAIRDHYKLFENVSVVFVTSVTNIGGLHGFALSSELKRYSNVHFCATTDAFIAKTFMPNWILPQVMLFNKQRKLKKIFYETVNADSMHYYLIKP